MIKIKNYFADIWRLFSPLELIIYLGMYAALNYFIFDILIGIPFLSAIMAIVGTAFFFNVFTFPNRKLSNYQNNLNGLLKYVGNMMFYLQAGENVYYSLQSTKGTVSEEIDNDIELTLDILSEEAKLDTEHFKKYNFPALNQFHQNLTVYYDRGGNPKDLFQVIQNNMITELKNRDELYRKRRGIRFNVIFLLLLVAATPIILRFLTPNLWETFLTYSALSIGAVVLTYSMFLLNLFFVQKQATDISVRIK